MRVDIDDGTNFIDGQGHWVKGQGQIGDFSENLLWFDGHQNKYTC